MLLYRFSQLISLLLLLVACNNPKGESVLAPNHSPFLEAPGTFSFTQVRSSNGNTTLKWSPSARVDKYKVFYGTAANDISTPVPSCTNSTPSCTVTGLNPATLYFFTVDSTNGGGIRKISSNTNALSVGTFDITASSAGIQVVNLSWSASSGATSYNVVYGSSPGSYPNVITNVTSPYAITGLGDGETVYARVIAVNTQNGYAESTSEATQTTTGPPAIPTGFTAVSSPGSVALNWNSSPGAATYRIYRGTSSGSLTLLTSGIAGTSYTDNTASNGTTYYYAVSSFNGYESAKSTQAITQPISSFSLTTASTYSATSIQLVWGNATGAVAYDVQYGTSTSSYTATLTNQTSPLIVPNLNPATTYYFAITARNAVGTGTTLLSNERSASTSNATPGVTITSSPTINNANKAAYTVSGACTENGRIVTVAIGSFTATPLCSSFTWTTTNNVTSVADSTSLSITANHSTSLGVSAVQASATVLKDTLNPTVTITSTPVIGTGNENAYTISGACSENTRTVSVNVGGVASSATCTALAWTTISNVSGVADDGAVAITVDHTDAAGNNATQVSTTVVKDTVVPTVTITSSPIINNTNKNAYTVSGVCSENTRTVSVNVGGVTSSPTCTTSSWSATLNVTAVSDGAAVSITVDHTDAAANNATQASTTVLKDTVIPTVIITSSPSINAGNQTAYVVSGTCSENTRTVSVTVGGVTSSATCTTSAWSTTSDVSVLADSGTVAITADHTDMAGNNSTQATTTVVKDSADPTVTITSNPVINNANKAAYIISGGCSENARTVSVSVGGVSSSPTCTALAWSTTLDVSGVADSGAIAITADHDDAAGNNATQATASVAKDTIDPTVTITSFPIINNSNKNTYTLSGACSENTRTVSVSVGGVTSSPNCSALAWSTTLDVSGVADSGSVVITADHSDSSGNNATQASASIIKDTTNPTVTITSSPIINNSNKNAYTISGACSENTRTVSVNVGGIAASPTCTALAWTSTIDASGIADGPAITITADHSDNAGNNATTATTTVLKNTANPTVSITSSPIINNSNKTSYTISGACSENTRIVSVTIGGISSSPTCTALAWSATLDVSGIVDSGAVGITADHTNSVGNNATQATASVVKDTSNPTVTITSNPVINNANKTAYTVSGACSENTRTVSVNVGGVTSSPACSALAWTATLDVSGVADSGAVAITADHSDSSGNTATQATASVVKDTSNPTVTITSSPVINNANKSAYTVSGACSENTLNVSVSVGGVTSSPTCTALGWTSTLNVSGVADSGTVAITADHSDSSGNNATQATSSVIKDTTDPTVTITSSPVINNSNKTAYTVSGACSENTRTVSVNVGGVTSSPICAALAWTATLDVSGIADSRAVAITADHSDSSGNNATQASASVVKDTSNPTVTISSSPIINNGNQAAYTVSGTCSETGELVSVSIGSVSSSDICTLLTWSVTVDISGETDTVALLITADHTDAAGNAGTQASTIVIKDTSNPTVTITSSPVINNANKTAYTVSGACSENTRTVSVSVGGVISSPVCTTLTWTATLDVSGVADSGTVAVTADHSDSSGNNATQATASIVKDTSNPTVTITSSPVINNANKSAYSLSGACSESTRTISVSVGGVTSSPTCTALAWTATLDVSGVADSGAVAITADHSDSAGNSATQAATSVVKDTSNPTVTITSSPVINNANKSAYSVSGACSENTRTISVSVGGVTSSPTCTALAWTATLDVSGVADSGAVAITADHSDSAGNSATQAATSVVKDTSNPTVTITSSPVINNANKSAYSISGACSENTRTISVSVGGVTSSPTCAALAWTATLDVTGLADSGTVAITANHSDAAGNTANQASTSVVKDTSNPTVTITSSPVINNANKASYSVSGTCSESGQSVSVNVGSVSASDTCTVLNWSVTVDISGDADTGALLITADHSDASFNSATQASTIVVKDTSNPTVTITSSPVINNANKAAYSLSGACSENTRTISVSVGGVTASPTCSALAWSTTLDVSAIADSGAVTITADHSDAAGNGATQATASVVKDTSNPTVTISSSPTITSVNVTAYTVSGACSENTRTVSVSVGGVTSSPTCTALAWSTTLDVSSVPDSGSVALTANHSDAAGNSATQATASVIKDAVDPTVTITSSPVINNGNKTSYTISGACSENTRTVSVSVGGVTSNPTCAALAWSATLNVSAVIDSSSVAITADHTDSAGNNAIQATTSTVKDTVDPTVTITSTPVINSGNASAYTISGACSENTRVVAISVGGVTSNPICAALAWSATLNVTGVADGGAVAITADHTDSAGNSATQAATSVVKDANVPTVTITSSPVINNANKSSYTISGACSENTRSVSVNVGGVSGSGTCTTLVWSATLNVTGVSDSATIPITADHTDAAGNSAIQATASIVKDTSNPTVTLTSTPVINSGNAAAYTISGACSENTRTVSVSVGGVTSSPACTALAWSATLNVSGLSDSGSIAISADHTDAAGNSATQATTTVIKDANVPTVTITSTPVINNSNKAAYTVSGACSENTRTVSVSVGGVTSSPICTTLVWSTTLNVSGVTDSGTVAITADHSDAAGNSATQATASVVKDTSNPTVTITSSPSINNGNNTAYIVSGACSENTRAVSVSVGGVTSSRTCTALAWSTTLNVSGLSDSSSIAITADHTDAVGNLATQATTTVIKDTTNPTVSISVAPTINNVNKASYTISGACSENTRTVSVNVGGVSGSGTCTTLAWSATLNVTGVTDGASVSITADHSDGNGNTATQASTSVLKDTIIPTVTIGTAAVINLSNVTSYTVSGTCSENARTVSLSVGGVTSSPTCTSLAWSITLDVSSASDSATLSITADHTDAAGNSATQASTLKLKDTVIPTVNVTFSPAIGLGNQSSYTVTGDCSENTRTVNVNLGGLLATPTCSSLAWSTTLNVSSLSDGTITITANHIDLAGNVATQSSVSVTKDTSIATVTIDTYPNIDLSNQTGYTISGSCSVNGTNVNLMIGSISRVANCSSNTWNSGIVDVSSLSDGPILLTADHSNAVQATRTVSKDILTETVTITSAPNITSINQTSYVASGTCSQNGQSVTINIDGLSFNRTCSGGTWSTGSVNVSSLIDGTGLIVTADHPSASQASTTINKATVTPTVYGLSVATTLTNSADLVWDLADPGGFTINDYEINYRIKGSPTWFSFTDGVNTNKYATVTGLNQSTIYEFRVRLIYDTSFQSAWTNTAEGETKPVDVIFSPYSAMNVGGSTLTTVVAIKDGTTVTLNGSPLTTLNKGQTFNFSSVKFDVIDADKPIYTAGRRGGTTATTSGNITWIPTAWAGRSFNFNATRNNPQILEVYAIENSYIEVKQGTTVLDSATVAAGTGATLTWSVYGSYQIVSSGNILAYHMSLNGTLLYDPKPIMPGFTEILGVPSQSMRLTADLDGTNYNFIHSNSVSGSGSLNKTDSIQINPQGTPTNLYQAASLLINADKKIGGASFADSNGNCAAPFMPTNLMKTTYAIPTNSDYAAFASKLPGTIQVRNAADTLITTLTLTRSGANSNAPYKVYLTNPLAGYRFISTVPMAAWYQPNNYTNAADQDETILYGTNE